MKVNISAADVGIDGDALNATASSEFIDCADASSITLLYSTSTRVAFTALHFEVDWYLTDQGTPTAFGSMGESVSQDGTNTVIAILPDKYTHTVAATVAGQALSIPCKARFCKIKTSSTAGDATDTITVAAVLVKTA